MFFINSVKNIWIDFFIFAAMVKQKTFAFICLASLLMFFQPSVSFISDALFNFHIEDIHDYSDIGDKKNNISNPLEEEILHSEITIESCKEVPFILKLENSGYSFKMKTSCKENATPPPRQA